MTTDNGLQLRTIDDVERVARISTASGICRVTRPEEAAVILLTGRELGLSPMQSLRGIYVVNKTPVLSADLLVAVVRRSGLCGSWRVVESTPDGHHHPKAGEKEEKKGGDEPAPWAEGFPQVGVEKSFGS